MGIEHYVWTVHAQQRIQQRRLDRHEIEQAISDGHDAREVHDGRAEWLVRGTTADGTAFEAIYDHPHGGSVETIRIVSAWRLG